MLCCITIWSTLQEVGRPAGNPRSYEWRSREVTFHNPSRHFQKRDVVILDYVPEVPKRDQNH
jgi:hypothetical protein